MIKLDKIWLDKVCLNKILLSLLGEADISQSVTLVFISHGLVQWWTKDTKKSIQISLLDIKVYIRGLKINKL